MASATSPPKKRFPRNRSKPNQQQHYRHHEQSIPPKKIAFLATDTFKQVELTKPWDAIKDAGAEVVLVSMKSGKIQGFNHDEKADQFTVDKTVEDVSTSEFNGLVLRTFLRSSANGSVCRASS